MPIPAPSSIWLTNIAAELNQMATLVQAIKTSPTAQPPHSNLSTICTSLGNINATLIAANAAPQMTDPQRHAMGDEFLKIGNELKK